MSAGEIVKIERVQSRKATKMVEELRGCKYPERLRR